jgi:hypothetical protein
VKLYQAIAAKVIGHLKMVDIIINWSLVSNHSYYIIRASNALATRLQVQASLC